MRFVAPRDRESLKRFGHLKRARGFGVVRCGSRLSASRLTCTRARGHRGPHAAHSLLGALRAVWDASSAASPGRRAPEVRSGSKRGSGARTPARRPVGLPSRRPEDLLTRVLRGAWKVLSNVEDLALLVLFLAFVGFAVQWLLLLLG